MASSSRPCATNKCEISSCAVCHCCQNNLCLDHLKEHKDQLNAKLSPLANHINTSLDILEHFSATSLPSFKLLEQWRDEAHQTVEQFYERMRHELFEKKKLKPQKKLHETRDTLDNLIRKQGATRENIDLLTTDIHSIEEEINDLQNIHINLRPLVIDDNLIIAPISSMG
jgi:replication fork clamp-binding protein CrfC